VQDCTLILIHAGYTGFLKIVKIKNREVVTTKSDGNGDIGAVVVVILFTVLLFIIYV